jgi:hypothetical protein
MSSVTMKKTTDGELQKNAFAKCKLREKKAQNEDFSMMSLN